MAKLYPPNINGTIPAFYYEEGTVQITVPFTMNRAVSPNEVAGFALKIKTTTGVEKAVAMLDFDSDTIITTSTASATFLIDNFKCQVGQHFKVQLAYKDKSGEVGYYSTVGIIKCTTRPTVTIEGLEVGQTNSHTHAYTGVYSQKGQDVSEKMYSSRFVLTDMYQNVIIDSGDLLHNTGNDIFPYESTEEFLINQDLTPNELFYLQFIVTTVNGLQVSSPRYRISQRTLIPSEITADLVANMDFDNGYVVLTLLDEVDPMITGTFLLTRASSKNNFVWEELKRFNLESMAPSDWYFRDYTVEQGIVYKYGLQQYNLQGVYSERIISNTLMADFEDMFLYDGERQLRIRFNPQVSSYKTNILENKAETIGSKYPYFSRNGNVNYKEFPISGLISYLMDEAENFIDMREIGLEGFTNKSQRPKGLNYDSTIERDIYKRYATTQLVDYNMAAERRFKNIVLDWLNDGQVKMFKSPAEGNFVVRLMNVSLSPNDNLSRMLHTFSCSAYEVADYSLQSLQYYGLIDMTEEPALMARWVTVDIRTAVEDYLDKTGRTWQDAIANHDIIILNTRPAAALEFRDMRPGAQVLINGLNIQMGATGAYSVYSDEADIYPIGAIKYIIDDNVMGQLTYKYYTKVASVFGTIDSIEFYDVPLHQIIGEHYNGRIWNSQGKTFIGSENVLDSINDVRTVVTNMIFLRAFKRPIETLYVPTGTELKEGTFSFKCYLSSDCNIASEFNWETANPLYLYQIRYQENISPYNTIPKAGYYVDATFDQFSQTTEYYIDGYDQMIYCITDDLFSFTLNGVSIDLTEKEKYLIRNDSLAELTHGVIIPQNGVILELCYTKQIKEYAIESDDINYKPLVLAKQKYDIALANMIKTRIDNAEHYNSLDTLKAIYETYLGELNLSLDRYKEEHGLE